MIKRILATAAATSVAATGAVLGATLPATAAAPAVAHGKIAAKGGVVVRDAPSRYAGKVTVFDDGSTFAIWCKVHGTNVDGNDLWYLNAGEGTAWVPARYVKNIGAAPHFCNSGDKIKGTVKAGTNIRRGPNTADVKTGHYAKGAKITVVCVTEGQKVGSSRDWFYTTGGRWVIGANVTLHGRVRFCAF